jgi:hypothetical protein
LDFSAITADLEKQGRQMRRRRELNSVSRWNRLTRDSFVVHGITGLRTCPRQHQESHMKKYVLAAILTAAVGLSPLAANAATQTHKKHHHSSHSAQRSMPSTTTTGMSRGSPNKTGDPNAGYQLSK